MSDWDDALEHCAKECEDGAVGPGVMFEWDGKLHALGESGVAALQYMAAQFRSQMSTLAAERHRAAAAPLPGGGPQP